MVLKGSELSPKCFHALVDIFYQAGLPRGCLNLLFVAPKDAAEVTTSIIAHPKVLKINFTGSGRVGSIIAATAGKYLKPVLMELGGKATAIVLEDADIEKAALGCALGAFLHVRQRIFLSMFRTANSGIYSRVRCVWLPNELQFIALSRTISSKLSRPLSMLSSLLRYLP